MFAGLDEIDWGSFGYHVYHGNEEIPNAVRKLLSENPDVREEARGFLLGWGQEYGDIVHATPHILPFVFELLADPAGLGKEGLLDHLSSIVQNIWDSNNLPIWQMRLYLDTYDVIRENLDILILLLRHSSASVRLATADVLQYMTNEAEILVEEFVQIYNNEEDTDVQLALLKGLKTLLQSLHWDKLEIKVRYSSFFYEIIDSHHDARVQVAAAQAAVEIYERYFKDKTELSPKVAEVLADEFLRVSASVDYLRWSKEFEQAKILIRDLAKLETTPLVELLLRPEITSLQAHLIAKGLMSIIVMYTDKRYWNCKINNDPLHKQLDYVHQYSVMNNLKIYLKLDSLVESRIRPFQAIIENQKFWEIPTNLFSFFFGLPDSRDELRDLLRQM